MIKIIRKSPTGGQLFRQKPGGLKPGFHGERRILFSKKGARTSMPVFRYFAVVGSALLMLLFVSDAYFGDSESDARFNGSLYDSAMYAPRLDDAVDTAELRFTRDAAPADRVKEVFGRFGPNESRRGKRYASMGTVIR